MIVQAKEQVESLQKKILDEVCYVETVCVNRYSHPAINTLSSIHVKFEDDSYYCIPVQHPDAQPIVMNFANAFGVVTTDKKKLLHLINLPEERVVDVFSMLYLNGEILPDLRSFYPPIIHQLKTTHNLSNIHMAVPLAKWAEYGNRVLAHIKCIYHYHASTADTNAYSFIDEITIPTLQKIEHSGLSVDGDMFISKFGPNSSKYCSSGKAYTEYNFYTSTGRPSNRFGGINFSALNKSDESRASFISRFGDEGLLVQFDYEAFHPRIAADFVSYELPQTSVHEYLAKKYYNTDTITKEQYERSKTRTFSIMYGQTDDVGDVEFFKLIKEFSKRLFSQYQENGYVNSMSGKRIVMDDPTESKVFNYLMQLTETEIALPRIKTVCDFLSDKSSKVVLYTYDAIVLDMHAGELRHLAEISDLLSVGGFHVRRYVGKTYNELELQK